MTKRKKRKVPREQLCLPFNSSEGSLDPSSRAGGRLQPEIDAPYVLPIIQEHSELPVAHNRFGQEWILAHSPWNVLSRWAFVRVVRCLTPTFALYQILARFKGST